MLYVTTRNAVDANTSYRTLFRDRAEDGGLYIPFRLPKLSPEEIDALAEKSFGQCVAEILKLLYGVSLDGWDVDFCIGRQPYRAVSLSHKIVVGETWRNPDWDFSRLVRNLMGRISEGKEQPQEITGCTRIAVRIAVLFGLFSKLERLELTNSQKPMDVAVDAADLSAAVSVLYCKRMGLSVGSIICSCTEDDVLWELFHSGYIPAGQDLRIIPDDLERLICEVLGQQETLRYVRCLSASEEYTLSEANRLRLADALKVVAVSANRVGSIIPNVYRTNGYVLSARAALAYGGLLDHRSQGIERKPALLLTEQSPICEAETVAGAMNIPVSELKTLLHIH